MLAALGVVVAVLSGCGGAQPAGSAAASGKAPAGVSAPASLGPEKAKLSVALPSDTGGTIPTRVGQDGGYFAKYGLEVDVQIVAAATAAQGLTSGSIDIYHGGTTPISASLAGADLIYFASPVDRSTLMLVAKRGISTFEQLRGKTVGTTTPGAFGELAMRATAKKYGMEIGKDVTLVYHPHSTASLASFLTGNTDALIAPVTYSSQALAKGATLVVDYYKEGLRIVGPALSSRRAFYKQNPTTIRAFLMGYLDALKRSIDDPAFTKATLGKYAKVTDQAQLDGDYEDGLKIWNRDIRVQPVAIQNALDGLGTPEAKAADVNRFYDNAIVDQVMRDYGAKLFPSDAKS